MTKHQLSPADREFRKAVEAGRISPDRFDHRAHVRLAYTYLAEHEPARAIQLLRIGLLSFLLYHGVDASKYHETLTRAWILAVRHFMELAPPCASADAFIDGNPALLDKQIMLTHYSAALLFSDEARVRFVEPDRDRIPRYVA